MNFNTIKIGLATIFLFTSGISNAGLITLGGLTLENAGDSYVTDNVNSVDYLRWDQVNNMNYNDLLTALQAGNAYDGWKIAGNTEANNFVNALLNNTSTCDSITNEASCFANGGNVDLEVFTSLLGFRSSYGPNENFEVGVFFTSFNGVGYEFGTIEVGNVYGGDFFYKDNEALDNDSFADFTPTGFMLYRDHAVATPDDNIDVPEPSTLAIFALGMIGLASRRFKKQS